LFTLREWVRAIEIIDSIAVVERSVRANDSTFSRGTVSVSSGPSRSDPAAPGWVRSSARARVPAGLGADGGRRRGEQLGQGGLSRGDESPRHRRFARPGRDPDDHLPADRFP